MHPGDTGIPTHAQDELRGARCFFGEVNPAAFAQINHVTLLYTAYGVVPGLGTGKDSMSACQCLLNEKAPENLAFAESFVLFREQETGEHAP